MRRRADAIGRVVQLARPRFEVSDELRDVVHRQRRRHHQDSRRAGDQRDRREIAQRVERQPLVERRVGGEADAADQQGMAVGRRLHHLSVPVLVLAPGRLSGTKDWPSRLPRPSPIMPRQQIVAAAGGERHDDLDRAIEILLRVRRRRRGQHTRRTQRDFDHATVSRAQRPSARAITCSQRRFSSSTSSPPSPCGRVRTARPPSSSGTGTAWSPATIVRRARHSDRRPAPPRWCIR